MFRKGTARNLDDLVAFDDAIADLLPYLEATPLHTVILYGYFVACVYINAVQLRQVAYRSVVASIWSSQSVRAISSTWKIYNRSGRTGYATAGSSSWVSV
jgi:hypothetical protein